MNFIEEAKAEIKKHNPKKVALQLPDGLKRKGNEIANSLGVETIVLAGSCFGACDLRDREAKELGCDLLLHFGHADFGLKTELPVSYIEVESELDIVSVVEQAAGIIKEEKIGLFAVLQHVKQLEKAKEILEKSGKTVLIGKPTGVAKYPGQVLGCDSSAATSLSEQVDAFLYLGTGNFHAVPVTIETGKKVYVADPELNQVRDVDELKDELLRQRFAKIEAAKKAGKFGILVTTKRGQNRSVLAEKLKELLESNGKEAEILTYDTIDPQDLENFQLDAYVNTACPRLPIDDAEVYNRPILSPTELEIVLGKREWEDYSLDHF